MSIKNFVSGFLFTALSLGPLPGVAESQTLFIVAGADNTLYEDPDGAVSNGEGGFMLAGRNNLEQDSIRRAVLYFDVAGQLPQGAIVEQASLILYLERGNGGERVVNLHRLLSDWGEGASAVMGGGLGAPAQPGTRDARDSGGVHCRQCGALLRLYAGIHAAQRQRPTSLDEGLGSRRVCAGATTHSRLPRW